MTDKKSSDKILYSCQKDIADIKNLLATELSVSKWQKLRQSFLTGVAKGVGLTIGASIVATFIVLALQWLIDWTQLNNIIGDWMVYILQSAISN